LAIPSITRCAPSVTCHVKVFVSLPLHLALPPGKSAIVSEPNHTHTVLASLLSRLRSGFGVASPTDFQLLVHGGSEVSVFHQEGVTPELPQFLDVTIADRFGGIGEGCFVAGMSFREFGRRP
jgi:hypothetical protein